MDPTPAPTIPDEADPRGAEFTSEAHGRGDDHDHHDDDHDDHHRRLHGAATAGSGQDIVVRTPLAGPFPPPFPVA